MWAESPTCPQFTIIGENKSSYDFLIRDSHDIDCLVINSKGNLVSSTGPRLARPNGVGHPFELVYVGNFAHVISSIKSLIQTSKREWVSINTLYDNKALTLSAYPIMHGKNIMGICIIYHHAEYKSGDLEDMLRDKTMAYL